MVMIITISDIAEENIEMYKDFAELHSINGKYNPMKGLAALLSALTPDSKIWVLMAIARNRDKKIQSHSSLDGILQAELQKLNVALKMVSISTSWRYIEHPHGISGQGSLVSAGAVERIEGDAFASTGYRISRAGEELFVPIALAAVNFVFDTSKNEYPHIYDSMVRLLGSITSNTANTRQMAVYRVVGYLVENPEEHTLVQVQKALSQYVGRNTAERIIHDLSSAGFVDLYRDKSILKVKANALIKRFYDDVLMPAWHTASTLTPYQADASLGDSGLGDKIRSLLGNYFEERTRIGPSGGEQLRAAILTALNDGSTLMIGQVSARVRENSGRDIGNYAVRRQLLNLAGEGSILVRTNAKGHTFKKVY
jgi:hypothetical protein